MEFAVDTILVSTGLVALAEIGDKTQLLAILLAARFRKPVPIVAGILVATILNHAAAAGLGYAVGAWLHGLAFQVVVGVGFLAMAAWALVPDKADDDDVDPPRFGVFLTTAVLFFLVEIGDKTQVATSLLGARFHSVVLVAVGTTVGMMLANVPAVLLGERVTRVLPMAAVRIGAALVFAALGGGVLAVAWAGT